MKNVIASVSCLDSINKISSLVNEMLYSPASGFLNLNSKEAIENANEYIKKFDYEVSKIQKELKFPLEDEIIKTKKKDFLSQIEKHCSKQILIWADETYTQFVDNLIFEVSIDKNGANKIFNNLIQVLNWYSCVKNISKNEYQLEFNKLQEKFNKAYSSKDADFIPKIVSNKTNYDDYMHYWQMALNNFDEFIKVDFSLLNEKLISNDIQYFQTIKNKALSQKARTVFDDMLLINSAIEILKLDKNKQKYEFVVDVLADFSSIDKNQLQVNEEEKIKLIKRRMSIFQDKNLLTKDYFKKMITSS